jgi:hypothetical protein
MAPLRLVQELFRPSFGRVRRESCPMVYPLNNDTVPEQAILRLQHPVVFVWECQEPARDFLLLKNVECRQAFRHRETIVLIAVNDEMGRFPVLDVCGGIPLQPRGTRRHVRASEFTVGEIQLLASELSRHTENSIMGDERLNLRPRSCP